jgi:uncharacterized protein
MKIRVEDITEEGLELNFSGDQDVLSQALEVIQSPEGTKIDPRIKGRLLLLKSGKDILLTGRAETLVEMQCSRCLTEFAVSRGIDVNLVVRSRGTGGLGASEERESAADEYLFDGEEFDPGEIVVQELLLDAPMKPLCNDDCPGLCPTCGAVKGSPECTCATGESVDPRWEALTRLKPKTTP